MGAIERFMSDDHARMDRLLAGAERADGSVDEEIYAELRHDLLRHIGMEEKVLLPYARAKRGGEALPVAARLRADHGLIGKLLVRSPSPAIVGELRAVLARHNPLEEGAEGVYATCDALAGAESEAVVERLRAQPRVPVAKYYDGPLGRG